VIKGLINLPHLKGENMNIFYLDDNPRKCAELMTDKHVVKMILETAQLMSTAHHVLDGDNLIVNRDFIYKKTHVNHPSALWVRENIANYLWARDHLHALLDEYAKRYNKKPTDHKTYNVFMNLFYPPLNIKNDFNRTPIRIAITNRTHVETAYNGIIDGIKSYRNYYVAEKLKTEKDKIRYLTGVAVL
jgi:hypothetical protein